MKTVTVFLFCSYICCNSVVAKPLNSDGPISPNLKMIATADGKSFFADRTVKRSWIDAGTYCTDLGMKLAEITSKAQDDALQVAYGPDFLEAYWTTGRDAYEPPPFAWNSTGDLVSGDYPEIRIRYPSLYTTCLYYWSRPNNDSALYYGPCAEERGTLCTT